MKKRYSSFKEIDNDLKILKLKKDIDLLCVKSDYQSILRNLSVKRIFSDTITEFKNVFFSRTNSLLVMGGEFVLRRLFGR